MLAEAYKCVRKVYLAIGYTDLRKGIDGLAQIIGTRYSLNPYDKDVLFLFCGKRHAARGWRVHLATLRKRGR